MYIYIYGGHESIKRTRLKRVNSKVLINKPRANRVVSEARGKKQGGLEGREIGRGQTSTGGRLWYGGCRAYKGKGNLGLRVLAAKERGKEGSAAVVRK